MRIAEQIHEERRLKTEKGIVVEILKKKRKVRSLRKKGLYVRQSMDMVKAMVVYNIRNTIKRNIQWSHINYIYLDTNLFSYHQPLISFITELSFSPLSIILLYLKGSAVA